MTTPADIVTSIAVVGNGPVGYRDSRMIDTCDLVMRFNKAKYGGVFGRRTDIMVVPEMERTGRMRFNRRAFTSATEFWLGSLPSPTAMNNGERCTRGKTIRLLDKAASANLIAPFTYLPGKEPSAGAMGIQLILELYPQATIHLFGFSHHGNRWHDWHAERDWCDSLVQAGRIHRHRTADNGLQKTMFAFKRGFVRFFENIAEGRPID